MDLGPDLLNISKLLSNVKESGDYTGFPDAPPEQGLYNTFMLAKERGYKIYNIEFKTKKEGLSYVHAETGESICLSIDEVFLQGNFVTVIAGLQGSYRMIALNPDEVTYIEFKK